MRLGGDVVVPVGKTLTIAAGTIVNVAQDDLLKAGEDESRIEFRVYGELVVQGTAQQPVLFECWSDSGRTWGPVILDRRYGDVAASFQHVVFRDMTSGIGTEWDIGSHGLNLSIVDCNFATQRDAVLVDGLRDGDSVVISGGNFTCLGDSIACGIQLSSLQDNELVEIAVGGGLAVAGYSTGIYMSSGGQSTIADTDISDCEYGIVTWSIGPNGPAVGPDVAITQAELLGVFFAPGTSVDGMIVSDVSGTGVMVSGGMTIGVNGFDVTNCGLHGVELQSCSSSFELNNVSINGAGSSGLRILAGSPSVGSEVVISSAAYAGVYCDDSDPALTGLEIADSGTGVRSVNGAHPVGRQLVVTGCDYGIIVDPVSRGDFGTSSDCGENVFSGIARRYALNWNLTYALSMICNCYDGSTNPSASMFTDKFGTTGTVNFTPAYCN